MSAIYSDEITNPGRAAIQDQANRLRTWHRKATSEKDKQKISQRADELRKINDLLTWIDMLEKEVLMLSESRRLSVQVTYAHAVKSASEDQMVLLEVIMSQQEKITLLNNKIEALQKQTGMVAL